MSRKHLSVYEIDAKIRLQQKRIHDYSFMLSAFAILAIVSLVVHQATGHEMRPALMGLASCFMVLVFGAAATKAYIAYVRLRKQL